MGDGRDVMIRSDPKLLARSKIPSRHRVSHVLQSVQVSHDHVQEDASVRILPRRC